MRQAERGEDGGNWLNWLPVAHTVSIDLDGVFVLGADVEIIGAGVMLQGPDAGTIFFFSDVGAAAGMDISASFKETSIWFSGDINQLTIQNMGGKRMEVNGSMEFVIDIGLSFSASEKVLGGRLYGYGTSAGVGVPLPWLIGGNANAGATKIWYPQE